MAQHVELRIETGLAVYCCDPHSPWQRGTNENTYWFRMCRGAGSSTGDSPSSSSGDSENTCRLAVR
jgi:IS30 family transposase